MSSQKKRTQGDEFELYEIPIQKGWTITSGTEEILKKDNLDNSSVSVLFFSEMYSFQDWPTFSMDWHNLVSDIMFKYDNFFKTDNLKSGATAKSKIADRCYICSYYYNLIIHILDGDTIYLMPHFFCFSTNKFNNMK